MVFPTTLTYGVTKVAKGYSEVFWRFCHPLTLAIQKVALPGKSAKRRLIGTGPHRNIEV